MFNFPTLSPSRWTASRFSELPSPDSADDDVSRDDRLLARGTTASASLRARRGH